MTPKWTNNSIICVDDEQSVRDVYQKILKPPALDPLAEILNIAGKGERVEGSGLRGKPDFTLLLASSGEEAIQLVEKEKEAGRRVAAGLFDMRMPGGMDGYETIEAVRRLDKDIICCVVTAYTDRNVTEIRSLFTDEHQDELLYVKKPFSVDELEQVAVNMVSAWNRKRKVEDYVRAVEKQRNGLRHILHAVSTFSKIPPHSLENLVSGLFFQVLGIIEGGHDGYCVIFPFERLDTIAYGAGKYELYDDLATIIDATPEFEKAFESNMVVVDDNQCYLPFVNSGTKIGGMYIRAKHSILDSLDHELLEVFKSQMGNLIMNSVYHGGMIQKEHESITDPLTGLYNRRFFYQRLTEEIYRNRREDENVSMAMMMLDIDHFKQVNDGFGHEAGDLVLKTLGEILRGMVRTYDLVGNQISAIGKEKQFVIRYGGEEFGTVLLDIDEEVATLVAERIRQKVEDHVFRYRESEIKITASIGLYIFEFSEKLPDIENFLSHIYRRADEALYRAKKMGRNRIEVVK